MTPAHPVRVGRRGFLAATAVAVAGAMLPRSLRADDGLAVGLVVPPPSPAVTALHQGALLGLDDANALATLFGKRLRLVVETAPDASAAADAARALARARALAVVGGSGAGFAEALRDVAAEGLIFMNAGSGDDALRNERCDRRVCHVTPSVAMHVDALVQWAVDRRKSLRWAIVEDGSPRGAAVESAARRALGRAGATVVSAADADVLLLAVAESGARAAVARARAEGRGERLAGIGGDVPLALGADDAAGVWAVGWHHELDRFSARELNGRFRRRFAGPLTETSWAAWAALKLIGEAVVRGNATDAAGLLAFFDSAPPFDGHKGAALTFRRWDNQLRQPLYVIGPRKREEIGGLRGPFAVLGDVGGNLDALGTPAAETRCRPAS